MNIIVGKTSGFCAGVKTTITKAEEELAKNKNVTYCLGEIIHNKQVVQDLEKKGLKIINSIDEANGKVIIRAHGAEKETYIYANEHNIELIDLTCPKVLRIHNQVQDFSNNNYFIFLIGSKTHPETIGTYSFCGKNAYIMETEQDIPFAIETLEKSKLKNVLVISQTTFSLNMFDKISAKLTNTLSSDFNIHIEKSICNSTDKRQKEAYDISSKVDLMIIIGGLNSSNTKKLYEVSKTNCNNVLHIQTKEDLNLNYIKKFENVGIMAGASTPDYVTSDVVALCQSI